MSETIIAVLISSIASPLILEAYRTISGKRSKAEEENRTRIIQLETRIADLQAANIKQLVEIGILQARSEAKDVRIHDLETQVQTLNEKRGRKI